MNADERKQEDIAYFNQAAANWENSTDAVRVAGQLIRSLGIRNDHSILDVASGTGIIRLTLADLQIMPRRYAAVDISSSMLDELKRNFSDAETYCADFEEEFELGSSFDYVIIFNSVPHFRNLDNVFRNAFRNLNPAGKFVIAHPRTREGLREHHKRIGYKSEREPIPADEALQALAANYDFVEIEIREDEYFHFSCRKDEKLEPTNASDGR
jgi:ubiquinone/menaquinone biosynthesis C-methylase UbiE